MESNQKLERHANDRPELSQRKANEIMKSLKWNKNKPVVENKGTEQQDQKGQTQNSTTGKDETAGKAMNQDESQIESFCTIEEGANITWVPCEPNVDDDAADRTPEMQLRGGDANARPPPQGRKQQQAPALQRKALGRREVPMKDVHGYQIMDQIDRFECTMNPSNNNHFEALRVQSLDWCHQPNATWYRTNMTNGTPWVLRFVFWFRKGIPPERRYRMESWTWSDYFSLLLRFLPAGLATSLTLLLGYFMQSDSESESLYLEVFSHWNRYPRISRNLRENRPETPLTITPFQAGRQGSECSSPIPTYRTFRPRYLCHIIPGEDVEWWFETRKVPEDNTKPLPKYAFVSYYHNQFHVTNKEDRDTRYHLLYVEAITSAKDQGLDAFWIDADCQPSSKSADPNSERNQLRMDEDVYTMSDIIRQAETTIVVTIGRLEAEQTAALKEWGNRVWTLPEILLGRSHRVISVQCQLGDGDEGPKSERDCYSFAKVDLALHAWDDAPTARQLVDHFHGIQLSRLELLDIALECFIHRDLTHKYRGDHIYAMMGLLRVRPLIDTTDSAFQAFGRLSLSQDSDRLIERLIFLLPLKPDEPWEKMSDQFGSSLWDIEPSCQVCGIGENDTIIVDGLYGGLIEWDRFHDVFQGPPGLAMTGRVVRIASAVWLIFLSVLNYVGPSSSVRWALNVGLTTGEWAVIIAFLLLIPLGGPLIFSRQALEQEEINPRLFGFEGYMPLDKIEERLWGRNLEKLSWNAHGSTRSRHRPGMALEEVAYNLESGFTQSAPNRDCSPRVDTYPVETQDPVRGDNGSSDDLISEQERAQKDYGEMKTFTLVDTGVMEVTLFESARPPIALLSGASEGGMRRAIACSLDIVTGTFYRETVFRLYAPTVNKFSEMSRVRIGLRSPWGEAEVEKVPKRIAATAGSPRTRRRAFRERLEPSGLPLPALSNPAN